MSFEKKRYIVNYVFNCDDKWWLTTVMIMKKKKEKKKDSNWIWTFLRLILRIINAQSLDNYLSKRSDD